LKSRGDGPEQISTVRPLREIARHDGNGIIPLGGERSDPLRVEANGHEMLTWDVPPDLAAFKAIVRVAPPSCDGETRDYPAEFQSLTRTGPP